MSTPPAPRWRGIGRRLGLVVLGLVAAAAVAAWTWGDHTLLRIVLESPHSGRCNKELTRSVLDGSLTLGKRYLLAHQKPLGNFDYEYDWTQKSFSADDNEVRQAGALWALALFYQDQPSAEVAVAIEKGLTFFAQHSTALAGKRCIAYPGSREGATGTVALVALSLVDYLRAQGGVTSESERGLLEAQLAEYLRWLESAVNPDGLWYGNYDVTDCTPRGAHSSYSDGEALLALIKAAKYLGHRELEGTIRRTAADGQRSNVELALASDRDSDVTKGYYQWSSMAFYELSTTGWPGTARFGDTVLRLADWMIDVHRTLIRNRNTGYAYEGLTHAYELSRVRGDAVRQAKYACVIDLGLQRLISWQVGSPIANRTTRRVAAGDHLALGGVQNAASEPALRIDVTGHQMHALLLARRYLYTR